MALLLWLGVRRSDVVLIGPSDVSDGLISFVQFKGRKKSQRIVTLPILPTLQNVLEDTPLGKETYLETAYGKPFSQPQAFGTGSGRDATLPGLTKCIHSINTQGWEQSSSQKWRRERARTHGAVRMGTQEMAQI